MNVTTMKWLEIVRFELIYQFRRRSTWFIFALFLFPLIGVTNDDLIDARNREILFHAPLFIAKSSVLMSVIALLVLAGVAGDAATRDVRTRMEPLMHAAPIGRAAYIGGRFFGAFAMAAILLVVVPLVHMLLPLFHPDLGAETLGPFRTAAYLQAYFLLIVPNAFAATALMFALATLVRHTLGSYVGAALVFAGVQFNIDFVAETLGRWDLAELLDSTGLIALEVMARTWSPVELNERLIGSEGALLWNRLLWLAIAFAVLVLTYRRFHFGGNADAVRWWQRGRLRVAGPAGRRAAGAGAGGFEGAVTQRSAPVAVPRVPRELGTAGRVRQTLAIARDSLREMATVWSWLVVPFLLLRVAAILGELNTMGAGTPVLPTTGRVLGPFEDTPPPIEILMLMLPVLLAGEVVWRERDANMQALADAAPVPDGVRFVGKLLGLWLMIVAFHGLLMLAGVVSQVVSGWYDFDFALYFQILFGLELVDPLVSGLLALSVHVLVNQKHVGHLVVLLLIVGLNGFAPLLGIEHPLLLYGSEPGWRHSPISGFGPFVGPVLWFELYWAAWTLLLALVARLFWVRGVERGMGERVRIARRRFTGQTVGAFTAVLGLILLVGGFIFYNTNILNAYHRTTEGPERQAEYERSYGRYEGTAQPELTATELNVEIYPDRREADVRGVHHLVNRTARPIDTIHVAVSSQVETGGIELGRPARAALVDDDLGHRIYVLEEPLQPGDSLRLSWQVRHDLNVQRMIRGMEASLEQFTERFGPYPYKVLRMVEYPAAGGSLHAESSAIWYQELFSLFDPARDPRRIDLPFAVTAHEVAHQWWGSQGARVEGLALLSESLAWYSAMGVIEQEYGTEHLGRFLGFMRRSYLTPRSRADVPLLRAADSFLAYRKGPFAMYALREYVGEERVDVALRRLRARYAVPEPPFATSLDLYRELQEVTPDSLQYLPGDLFERNTFWELETRQATALQTPGGEWQVSLDVVARKVVVDTVGAETDVPMDDLVEIGVFAPAEAGEGRGKPLHLAMHRVRTGPQTITVTVPQRPARAGIDPRHLLIDVEPDDNLVDVPDPSSRSNHEAPGDLPLRVRLPGYAVSRPGSTSQSWSSSLSCRRQKTSLPTHVTATTSSMRRSSSRASR
ncbi:MAG: hypothetical protein GEU99_22005 [Luteitalea sp.]|nr:hypothetical protein [Luteitalea sp.]